MEMALIIVGIVIGALILFFATVGLTFLWVVNEAQKMMDKRKQE